MWPPTESRSLADPLAWEPSAAAAGAAMLVGSREPTSTSAAAPTGAVCLPRLPADVTGTAAGCGSVDAGSTRGCAGGAGGNVKRDAAAAVAGIGPLMIGASGRTTTCRAGSRLESPACSSKTFNKLATFVSLQFS